MKLPGHAWSRIHQTQAIAIITKGVPVRCRVCHPEDCIPVSHADSPSIDKSCANVALTVVNNAVVESLRTVRRASLQLHADVSPPTPLRS